MEFPARQQGTLTASHLLVFDTDTVDPLHTKPLMSPIALPALISAPARTIVTIRDVCLDLHTGLQGNWQDADGILNQRLKRAFQQEAMTGV